MVKDIAALYPDLYCMNMNSKNEDILTVIQQSRDIPTD